MRLSSLVWLPNAILLFLPYRYAVHSYSIISRISIANRPRHVPVQIPVRRRRQSSRSGCTSTELNLANPLNGGGGGGGIYRPFAEYAWSKLQQSGLFDASDTHPSNSVPEELASNVTPARGMPEGTDVTIEVRSMSSGAGGPHGENDSPIRLARYALLETLAPSSNEGNDKEVDEISNSNSNHYRSAVLNAIHVLNLVVFPNPNVAGCSALPVLGLDLVTLPNNKHLVAIDFQPLLPLPGTTGRRIVLPSQYADFEERFEGLHRKHCLDSNKLPWGGDIPAVAQRYFSPYAVWTRLGDSSDDNDDGSALTVVQTEVFRAFCEYVDLYIDLMTKVQQDNEAGLLRINAHAEDAREIRSNEDAKQGQRDYLLYRRENDPARPMLKSLYGEEWTEKLIGDVLFKML